MTTDQTESTLAASISSAVASYNVTDASIAEMAEKYGGLTTNGPEDEEALIAVKAGKKAFAEKRIAVEKKRVDLKSEALAYGQAVDAEARRIKGLIEPHESRLKAEEDKVKAELDRRADEAARLVREETDRRVTLLSALGAPFSVSMVEAMLPDEFDVYLSSEEAKALAAREEAARMKAESDRIAAEQAAEAQRLEDESRKVREAKAEQDRRDAAADADRRAKAAEAQAALDAERAAFEAEKAESERVARVAAEEAQAKARAEAAEAAKKAAFEEKRLKDIAVEAEADRVAALAPLERIAERLDVLCEAHCIPELHDIADELRELGA